MKKENLNMDKTFRDKLEGFSVEPPPHMWDNIQGQLAAQRKNRRLVFVRWIAAAAVVILAFLAGWYFNEKSEQVVPVRVENQVSTPGETVPQPENNGTKQLQKNQNSLNKQDIRNNESNEPGKPALSAASSTSIETTVQVAETLDLGAKPSENNQQENTSNIPYEKFTMSMLNRRVASIKVEQSQPLLKKQQETTVDQLSETEKVLITENAKRYSEPEEKSENWKMGLSVSPGYASQVTGHTDNYAQNMTYSGTEGNRNVSGGFSVQYKTGKKWSVESGIYYAQNGQRSSNAPEANYYNSVSGPSFDSEKSYFNTAVNMVNGQMAMNSTAGVIEFSGTPRGTEVATSIEDSYAGSNTLLTSSEFLQVFDFIEIPLYVRYNVIDAKIGVQVLGGINAGIVAGNNVLMENRMGTQNVGKTQDISTLNISGTIGFGLNYGLSRHISLAIEPRLNYYLNSINKNPDVVFRPYRIGVYTGLYYQF
jgi:hypothetical protein